MSRMRKLTHSLFWCFLAGLALGAMTLSSFYLYLRPGLPDVEQILDIQLQTPLRIYSSDNRLIAEFGEKRREPVTIDQIPELQLQAFLAAEDARFYEHSGVDIKGLVRAAWELVSTGSIRSGGSTITMQVAKNYFLTRDRTFIRKFNEILLALQMEQELSKSTIIELYFNKIYLGNRAYGLQAAAEVYYGQPVRELTLAQMAMLAGLPKAPSAYNPLANPERALIRRNWILQRMHDLEYIGQAAHELASDAPVTARYHGAESALEADYLAEMTRTWMVERFGDQAYTDGYEVSLTIDSTRQSTANQALRNGLKAYDRRHGYRGPVAQASESDMASGDFQSILAPHESYAGLYPAVVTGVSDAAARVYADTIGPATMAFDTMTWARPFRSRNRLGPTPESPADVVSVGDVVYVEGIPMASPLSRGAAPSETPGPTSVRLSQVPEVQGALVSLDPHTGGIQSLTGGFSFSQSKYNRATQARRQPGSNFKPFLYLAALEHGKTPATLINDAPIVFDDIDLETTWRPQNASGEFYGPTRLRKALYRSRNLVSIRLLRELGIDNTVEYLGQLGIDTSQMSRDLSLALGSGTLTPMEIARGFAVIANGGYNVSPYFVQTVRNSDGDVVYEAPAVVTCDDNCEQLTEGRPTPAVGFPAIQPAPRVADERSVYILHSMMKDVVRLGTGRRARALGRDDIAGKTGTTNQQRDAWFSGFNHNLAASAWVGFDQPQPMGRGEYGATAALPVWADYMEVALAGTEPANMPRPNGLVTVKIDAETGKRARPDSKNTLFEIFRTENAPEPVDIDATASNDGSNDSNSDGQMPQQLF